jgi:hypothetical protein
MDIKPLIFTRDWRNPEHFPTLELDETVVRADMQALHNEVKEYLNTVLTPAVEQLSLNVTKVIVMTLAKDKWNTASKTQSTVAGGVLEDETKQLIQLIPASASQAEYLRCAVKCTSQKADTLMFTAALIPSTSLTVYAVVTEVSV